MPKIKPGMPKPPAGWERISAGLDAFDSEMKNALAEPSHHHKGQMISSAVTRVNSARTRYVVNAVRSGLISQKVMDYCVQNGFIDGSLVRLWAAPGYESSCCAACVDARQSTFGGSCVCRVPSKDRVSQLGPQGCSRCGCTGCAPSDVAEQRRQAQAQAQAAAAADDGKASGSKAMQQQQQQQQEQKEDAGEDAE